MISIYLILYLVALFISIISLVLNTEIKGYKLLVFIIILLVFFRFDTGWDYYWYWYVGDKSFEGTSYYIQAYNSIEIFYKKLYDVTRFFTYPPLFFMITGLISSFFIYKGIYGNSKSPLVALSIYLTGIYFFVYSLGFIRQHLAINAVFYAFKYLKQDKLIKYIICIICITFIFHYSAIIGIFFIFIKKIKLKYLIIGISTIPFIKELLHLGVNFFYPKYNYYFIKSPSSDISTQVIIYALFALIIYLVQIKKNKNYQNELSGKIFWCGLTIYIVLNQSIGGHLGFRISNYMLIFILIYISDFISTLKNKNIYKILVIVFFYALGSISITRGINYEEKNYLRTQRKNFDFKFIFNKTEKSFQQKQLPFES